MKNGFTLIELLAVIVILAIIALIAVPIVLNIINNSKESASIRSAELYVKAVEYAIANKILDEGSIDDDQYPIMSNGSICLKNYNYDEETKEETCNGVDINSKDTVSVLRVEVSGEYPKEGYVVIEKGQVVKELSSDTTKKTELVISGKPIVKNDNNEFVLEENDEEISTESICKLQDGYLPNEVGSKYLCEVKKGSDPYVFFILSASGDKVNLIMEANINAQGEPIKSNSDIDKGIVKWCSLSDYQSTGGTEEQYDNYEFYKVGPITAMNYLNNATSSWREELILNETYSDSYFSIPLMGKARMPYMNEIPSMYETFFPEYGAEPDLPLWYFNYTAMTDTDSTYYPTKTSVDGVYGYHILNFGCFTIGDGCSTQAVMATGVQEAYPSYSKIGVRPVITIKTTELSY